MWLTFFGTEFVPLDDITRGARSFERQKKSACRDNSFHTKAQKTPKATHQAVFCRQKI